MTIIEALFLGLIQGITEFIPVSSSGHLAIIENLLNIKDVSGLPFAAAVHLATLIAVFAALRREVKKLFIEICRGIYDITENFRIYRHNRHEKDARRYKRIVSNNYRKLFLLLIVSAVPTVIEGYLLENAAIFAGNSLFTPAVGMLITGIILLVADFFPRGRKIPKDVSYSAAFVIGVLQGLTVFPGVSRLGITLAVCLAYGFQKKFAIKYTLLLAIPVFIGAFILECTQLPSIPMTWGLLGCYVLGAAAAGIAGYFCIGKMMKVLQNKKFYGFSVYCFIIGGVTAVGSILFS
ncbi:MAG TPA: undecaprenyl-diphosphate phosphatase [Candidatus Blautia stercoripullorum]|uniref:Undecaprenyl-diphosphatase n=1 Tax=Candidatus Blautia stercoripullorum TaxID=2838502 RepID=A0A9D2RB57_9FIRM|nr:undecaprenyl-diphosphate phosphatase [Candidatus Blautia stercoripullorum]